MLGYVWLENRLSLKAQSIFEPNRFPCKYPNILYPVILHTYLPMKMEQCSETSAYKIQTSGNYPEEIIQHSEQGESLKSRIDIKVFIVLSVTSCCYVSN